MSIHTKSRTISREVSLVTRKAGTVIAHRASLTYYCQMVIVFLMALFIHHTRVNIKRDDFSIMKPQGRKQIVQYEADTSGFRPKISYEGEANANSGYPSGGGGNGGNGGYPSGPGGGGGGNNGFGGGNDFGSFAWSVCLNGGDVTSNCQ